MKNKKKVIILLTSIIAVSIVILAGTKIARNMLQTKTEVSSSQAAAVKDNNTISQNEDSSKADENKDNTIKESNDSKENTDKNSADAEKASSDKESVTKKEETSESKKPSVSNNSSDKQTSSSNSQGNAAESKKNETSSSQAADNTVKSDPVPESKPETDKKTETPNFTIVDDVNHKTFVSKAIEFDGSKNLEYYTKEFAGGSGAYFNNGYVAKMFNLKEKSAGPLSGWVYYVNGVKPGYGMRDCYPKKGDIIVWKFVSDGVNN